jgi:hypothetical protein
VRVLVSERVTFEHRCHAGVKRVMRALSLVYMSERFPVHEYVRVGCSVHCVNVYVRMRVVRAHQTPMVE